VVDSNHNRIVTGLTVRWAGYVINQKKRTESKNASAEKDSALGLCVSDLSTLDAGPQRASKIAT